MFKRILVAIDASEYTRHVVPTAMEVAAKFDSEVFVLHVCEHDRGHAAAFTLETPAEATELVADAVQTFRKAGMTSNGRVADVAAGHVAKAIVEAAAALPADLIVMGSRGLSAVQGLLLGSVTQQVLQLAHMDVLVARGPLAVKVTEVSPAKLVGIPAAV